MDVTPQKHSVFVNNIVIGIASITLSASIASAGTMGDIASSSKHQPLVSLSGGFASVHAGHSQSYFGTDNDLFAYYSNGSNKNAGLVGVFLGEELSHLNISPSLLIQAGLEYTYLGNSHFHGSNTVGFQPNTSTLYQYNYTLQSQQLLLITKVLMTTHQIFHPYVSAGVGAAFNHSANYDAYTLETGSINLTPTFDNKNQTEFSYALGVGVDTTLNKHLRLGLGYRFTDMGKASFGNGNVVVANSFFPTAFSLIMPRVYANQLVAQLSYLA